MTGTSPIDESAAARRLAQLKETFEASFDQVSGCPRRGSFVLASAPGRMEVAGNHVDHQGGCVISAAIGERTWGLGAENGLGCVRVVMEGFGVDTIDLSDPSWADPRPVERESSAALVRGVLATFERSGVPVRGFDAVTVSEVPAGCGLSSSAAFEVMMGALVEGLFGDGAEKTATLGAEQGAATSLDGHAASFVSLDPVPLALKAVEAEQRYFGKPCGAQDQLASACGDVVAIDFTPAVPTVTPVALDVEAQGFGMVLVDSGQDHSLHQDEFAAIPADMRMVASLLGASRLGDVAETELLAKLRLVRSELGDRRAMRALHYFDEVTRVRRQCDALAAGDFAQFLRCVRLSGASSAQFLQNVSLRDPGSEARQPAMVIQSLCAHLLEEEGAWRIHGGGFGGSVLAFVPLDRMDGFTTAMDELLGYDACRRVSVGGPGVWAVRLS